MLGFAVSPFSSVLGFALLSGLCGFFPQPRAWLCGFAFQQRAWLCEPAFIPTCRGGRRLSRSVIGAVFSFSSVLGLGITVGRRDEPFGMQIGRLGQGDAIFGMCCLILRH